MEIAERSARWRRQIWESAANGNKGGIESRTVPPGPQSILKKPPVAWQWTRLPVVSKEPPAPLGMGAYTSAGGPASASSRPMGPWILVPAGRQSTSSRERQMAIRTISLDLAHTIVRTALLFAPGQCPALDPISKTRPPQRRSGLDHRIPTCCFWFDFTEICKIRTTKSIQWCHRRFRSTLKRASRRLDRNTNG